MLVILGIIVVVGITAHWDTNKAVLCTSANI